MRKLCLNCKHDPTNCCLQIHNDYGLNIDSRHLKDVGDERWDLSEFTDIGLGRRDGADVCMCCVRENSNDGAGVHQQPNFIFIVYNYLVIPSWGGGGSRTSKIICLLTLNQNCD